MLQAGVNTALLSTCENTSHDIHTQQSMDIWTYSLCKVLLRHFYIVLVMTIFGNVEGLLVQNQLLENKEQQVVWIFLVWQISVERLQEKAEDRVCSPTTQVIQNIWWLYTVPLVMLTTWLWGLLLVVKKQWWLDTLSDITKGQAEIWTHDPTCTRLALTTRSWMHPKPFLWHL